MSLLDKINDLDAENERLEGRIRELQEELKNEERDKLDLENRLGDFESINEKWRKRVQEIYDLTFHTLTILDVRKLIEKNRWLYPEDN